MTLRLPGTTYATPRTSPHLLMPYAQKKSRKEEQIPWLNGADNCPGDCSILFPTPSYAYIQSSIHHHVSLYSGATSARRSVCHALDFPMPSYALFPEKKQKR